MWESLRSSSLQTFPRRDSEVLKRILTSIHVFINVLTQSTVKYFWLSMCLTLGSGDQNFTKTVFPSRILRGIRRQAGMRQKQLGAAVALLPASQSTGFLFKVAKCHPWWMNCHGSNPSLQSHLSSPKCLFQPTLQLGKAREKVNT